MGLSRFELLTPRLSSVCSNQLSYRPLCLLEPHVSKNRPELLLRRFSQNQIERARTSREYQIDLSRQRRAFGNAESRPLISRKEVIQPQVLLQLPCYDFTPITDHTLGASLPCGLVWRLLVQPAFVM